MLIVIFAVNIFGNLLSAVGDVVGDAGVIEEFLLGKGTVLLLKAEDKGFARICHRLLFQGIGEKLPGDIGIGKDFKIGTPVNDSTRFSLISFKRSYRKR